MSEYRIEVKHDDSGKVVKTLNYANKSQLDKGYKGLLRNLNMGEYTAEIIEPVSTDNQDKEVI